MMRLRSASVLVSGIGGCGVEIAKNLILGGVRRVTIQDTISVSFYDLSSQYYLDEADIGENRADRSFKKLAELNDSVNVTLSTEPLTEEIVAGHDVFYFLHVAI